MMPAKSTLDWSQSNNISCLLYLFVIFAANLQQCLLYLYSTHCRLFYELYIFVCKRGFWILLDRYFYNDFVLDICSCEIIMLHNSVLPYVTHAA